MRPDVLLYQDEEKEVKITQILTFNSEVEIKKLESS